MTEVTVYGRPGCHLCEEAIDLLTKLRSDGGQFRITSVNIEDDPALHSAFLERIPVIEVEGEVISELVPNLDTIRQTLDTLIT